MTDQLKNMFAMMVSQQQAKGGGGGGGDAPPMDLNAMFGGAIQPANTSIDRQEKRKLIIEIKDEMKIMIN
jgi:hypothetical protein